MPNNDKKPFRYRVLSLWDKLIEMFKPTIKSYRDEDDDDNNDGDKDEQIRELPLDFKLKSSEDQTLYQVTSERARRHEEERIQEEEILRKKEEERIMSAERKKVEEEKKVIVPLPVIEIKSEEKEKKEFEPEYLGDDIFDSLDNYTTDYLNNKEGKFPIGDDFFDSPEEYHLGDNINMERNCRDDRDDDDLEL